MKYILLVLLVLFAAPAQAQDLSALVADGGAISARTVQLFVLLTILSIVPALAIMFTCFPFMVTVLSILRQGLGLQQAPPNMMIVSLALFLTYFVMEPVFQDAWSSGVDPLLNHDLSVEEALARVITPFRGFMIARVDPEVVATLQDIRATAEPSTSEPTLSVLVPSFLISEVTRAFEIGFLVFLPFLLIDLVVAAVLMSMGMMMVPPAMVALPFKLAFFVVADGWSLISAALVSSYS